MCRHRNILGWLLMYGLVVLLQPIPAMGLTAKQYYFKAEACHKDLKKNTKKQKYRHNWLKCIDLARAVYETDPTGPWAAAGLYKTANLYRGLYRWSHKSEDIDKAIEYYHLIEANFPSSRYRKRAARKLAQIPKNLRQSEPVTPDKPEPKKEKKVKVPSGDETTNQGIAIVNGLRYWSNPRYTRVVIDADNDIEYSQRLLNKDPSLKTPKRLYIDLTHSKMGQDLKKDIPIDDNLLSGVRAGQYKPDIVRVVIDIKSSKTYKIFSLKNPFRIVIDVWGSESKGNYAGTASSNSNKETKPLAPSALARQLALGVSTIVIDPGHGGKDYGAPGYVKGINEKDIVLEISKRLAKQIRKELNCKVILTRNDDRFLSLEERTAIANTHNADLFISIHTNATRDKKTHGIETYFLNLATDDDSILVAARENATSRRNISDLQNILNDLMQNAKINESSRLATNVQNSLTRNLEKKYSRIKNIGVKQAPFYVLIGAEMPAILVETSFISNARECKRLKSSTYQEEVCKGIISGISEYMEDTNPTAFNRPRSSNGS